MNRPHEQQAAAMARAGELTDREFLRECVNSGQVSAAQVVAHAEASELSMSMFASREDFDKAVGNHVTDEEVAEAIATYQDARTQFAGHIKPMRLALESFLQGRANPAQEEITDERFWEIWVNTPAGAGGNVKEMFAAYGRACIRASKGEKT